MQEKVQINWFNKWLQSTEFVNSNLSVELMVSLEEYGNYMFKVNNRNTRTWCKICSKLTIKTPERCPTSLWCLC